MCTPVSSSSLSPRRQFCTLSAQESRTRDKALSVCGLFGMMTLGCRKERPG